MLKHQQYWQTPDFWILEFLIDFTDLFIKKTIHVKQ